MQNLYWKTSKGKTVNLLAVPFDTEMLFEDYVFANQELLEDIFIFKRQVRSGSRQGIPDMVGVDQDGKVCLIELKKNTVTEDVLPQVLQYAIWAETNPDSVKALWLEADDRPDDIDINWDALEIRVLVVGPDFRPTVLRMSGKIGYSVELLKVTRFVLEGEEFIIVEQLDTQPDKVKTTKGRGTWDRAFYESEHGKGPTKEFMKAVKEIEAVVKKEGWALQTRFNKYYVGFKYGNRNAFNIGWDSTKTWSVYIKVTESVGSKFTAKGWQYYKYSKGWKEALFRRTDPTGNAGELEKLFAQAYHNLRGDA